MANVMGHYRDLFNGVPIGLYRFTPDWQFLDANPALVRILRYEDRDSLCATSAGDIYFDTEHLLRWQALIEREGVLPAYQVQWCRRDGQVIWVENNARTVRDPANGRVLYYEGSIEDITDRKRAEQQLHYNAFHDSLTNLPNRALFADHLKLAFERAKRRPGYYVAIMFLDLDRFKVINDSLGHDAGDKLLISVAERLKLTLRPEDTIARLGGDEFAVLLDGIEGLPGAIHIAERIERELSAPFPLGGRRVFTSASIGIALCCDGGDSPETLMRNADIAMYRAKSQGKGHHAVFDREMHARAMTLLQTEIDLQRAVEEEQFRLHYQPIMSLGDEIITGFEALIRWQHPERGLLPPDKFISIAEESGLIIPIGQWVLREACEQLRRWQKETSKIPPITMSVNLSGKQFAQLGLVEEVRDILRMNDLSPRSLKLEITESVVLRHGETAALMLRRLQNLGVDLVTDDFGTGYSSLSYLHQFPINGLKIDRSFVSKVGSEEGGHEIVRSLVMLANNLHLDVVAEGIEEKAQLSHLRELMCGYGQGYYFSPPLEREAAYDFIVRFAS